MSERKNVAAMCLTCGAARQARAIINIEDGGFARLVRPNLTCRGCGAVTEHDVVDRMPWYGDREDGLRFYCAEANRLIAVLAEMPNIDLRWSEGRWCLAHGYAALKPSLDWIGSHPGEDRFPCVCDQYGEPAPGAAPAGFVVADGERWLVELDLRQSRERLVAPLRRLVRLVEIDKLTPGPLPLAYNVDWNVRQAGQKLGAGAVLRWGSEVSR